MNRRLSAAILVGLAIAGSIVTATIAVTGPARAGETSAPGYAGALAQLQYADARLQSIGWRLATGNARYCQDARPEVGLLLQDIMNYGTPSAVRAAAGITTDIVVQAVAEGSPAAQAGLMANDEVLAIDGQATSALPVQDPGDHRRLFALHARIGALLAAQGRVALRVRSRGGAVRDVSLIGVPACPSRFEVLTGKNSAQADGQRVVIGYRFGQASRPADTLSQDEFAAIVAHELAHNLLHHRAWLDQVGRGWGKVRRTEREADRLAVWLLTNAGYDPEAGPRLMAGWGRRGDVGFLKIPTHDGWDERVEHMEQEVVRIRAALKERGEADWSRDFIRGI